VSEEQEPSVVTGWHLKKEVQLSHIVTTLVVGVSAGLYITKLEQRIALVEQAVTTQHERDERQDKVTADAMNLLRIQLDKMDQKLDRLVERGTPK
jgi:hypothetical protein